MPLIDKTYFIGEINIPDTGNPAVEERLNFFIAKYEEEFLKTVLGYSLYNAYVAGIAVDPPDVIWTDLRDGKEYIVGDLTYKYRGFVNTSKKLSPIADYVYYWWTRSDTKAKPDDAQQQAAYYGQRNSSMIRAWNEMALWVQEMTHFLNNNALIYPEWQIVNWYTAYYHNSITDLMRPINSMNL
jgi:hypothetical protein